MAGADREAERSDIVVAHKYLPIRRLADAAGVTEQLRGGAFRPKSSRTPLRRCPNTTKRMAGRGLIHDLVQKVAERFLAVTERGL